MSLKKQTLFLELILVSAAFLGAYGDDRCVPAAVKELEIFSNATLYWEVDPDEPCEVTVFKIDVVGDRADEYHFTTIDNHVNLDYLEICEEWRFTVTVISHGVLGYPKTLTEYIPLPPNADLSLSYFNATWLGERDVLLEWDLLNHTHGDCTLHYRLSIEDEDLGIQQDVYVQGSSLHISVLSPCVQYQLGLRAVNKARPFSEGPQRLTEFEIEPEPQKAPTLLSIDVHPTSVNMTWRLEGGTNRCPLSALYANGGHYFNFSVPLQNSMELFPTPVPVQLTSLQPNSMYFFQVSIANSGGLSPPVPLAVQTLELSPN